jgi:hypothetical protein
MSTIIQIKRSSGTTAPASLKLGEIAYTYGSGTQGNAGDRLFIGTGGIDVGTGNALFEDIIGGKYFTQKLDHVDGTLTASSAILVDANLAINTINIGNALSTGGEIRFNEGTNNGTAYIGLKAPNDISGVSISKTYTLPVSDGTTGQFLKTDGSGNLAFATVNQFITLSDGTDTDQYNTSETLLFTGGQSITTEVDDNEITFSVTALSIDTGQLADDAVTNAKIADPTTTLGSSTLTLGATTTDISGLTSLVIDDITINGQSITTTADNRDIALSPHGSGTVTVPSGYKDRAGFTSDSLATKEYVDATSQGLDVKNSVRLATTVELTNEDASPPTYDNGTAGLGATLTFVSTITTIDGVSGLQNGDRILIKNQTAQATNGIYVRTSGTVYTRAVDADTADDITGGTFVFVEQGTANADNGYVFTHEGTPTVGTTALTVGQFSGAGQITAGDALLKTGNTLDVRVDDSSIEITADTLNVKALGVTNAMLAGSITRSKLAYPFINFSDETSSSGQVQLEETLEFLAGEGINTVASGSTLTISGELATTSNIGVASFNTANFAVSSGDVTITTIDGGNFS